ncbi:unnamed protein product [Arctia plantaginis]|uniref:Uncharacterized protein n=1 Tax=Arctia plantaginis TaxID=874455 RepID=A0A8S1B1W5_ARCPL|nr:unnamed protein product [Arctia plantaginis]
MATKLSSIKHRKSCLSIVGGQPDKRYVTARSTMQTVGVYVGTCDALCQCHNSRNTQMWRGRGAATNRATIPARWPAMPHRAIKAVRWRQSVCARAVARTHALAALPLHLADPSCKVTIATSTLHYIGAYTT